MPQPGESRVRRFLCIPSKPKPIYTYKSLTSSQDIRLLHLLPGTGRIRCQLVTVSLWGFPEYDALSYTWGTDPASHEIELDGCRILVGGNLYAALGNLRQRKKKKAVLWVDAL